MCKKCNNNSCFGNCNPNGAAGDSAQLSAQVSSLTNIVNNLTQSLGALLNGHPIIAFENASDIALFNLTTGVGSGYLANWGICNGNSYPNPTTGTNVITPNLIDRCLIQATGTYAVDAVTGAATGTISIPNLPAHTHVVNDPGHNHVLIDPGHIHAIQDGALGAGHTHATLPGTVTGVTGTTDTQGAHVHGYTYDQDIQVGSGSGTHYPGATLGPPDGGANPGGVVGMTGPNDQSFLQTAGAHSHNVTVNNFNVKVTVEDAFTGVEVLDAQTGLSNSVIGVSGNQPNITGITNQNTGSGTPVSLMQPSYAVIYAMKIY